MNEQDHNMLAVISEHKRKQFREDMKSDRGLPIHHLDAVSKRSGLTKVVTHRHKSKRRALNVCTVLPHFF